MVETTLNRIAMTPGWKFWYVDQFRSSTKRALLEVGKVRLGFDVNFSSLNKKNSLMFVCLELR